MRWGRVRMEHSPAFSFRIGIEARIRVGNGVGFPAECFLNGPSDDVECALVFDSQALADFPTKRRVARQLRPSPKRAPPIHHGVRSLPAVSDDDLGWNLCAQPSEDVLVKRLRVDECRDVRDRFPLLACQPAG